jgi:hypothetical protein
VPCGSRDASSSDAAIAASAAAAGHRPSDSAKCQLGRLRLSIKTESTGGDNAMGEGSPSKRRRQGECGTPTGGAATPAHTPTGVGAMPVGLQGCPPVLSPVVKTEFAEFPLLGALP